MTRTIKSDGNWKHRPLDALAKDLEAAVCDAAVRWEQQRQGLGSNEELFGGFPNLWCPALDVKMQLLLVQS